MERAHKQQVTRDIYATNNSLIHQQHLQHNDTNNSSKKKSTSLLMPPPPPPAQQPTYLRDFVASVGNRASTLYQSTRDSSNPKLRDGLTEVEERLKCLGKPLMSQWKAYGDPLITKADETISTLSSYIPSTSTTPTQGSENTTPSTALTASTTTSTTPTTSASSTSSSSSSSSSPSSPTLDSGKYDDDTDMSAVFKQPTATTSTNTTAPKQYHLFQPPLHHQPKSKQQPPLPPPPQQQPPQQQSFFLPFFATNNDSSNPNDESGFSYDDDDGDDVNDSSHFTANADFNNNDDTYNNNDNNNNNSNNNSGGGFGDVNGDAYGDDASNYQLALIDNHDTPTTIDEVRQYIIRKANTCRNIVLHSSLTHTLKVKLLGVVSEYYNRSLQFVGLLTSRVMTWNDSITSSLSLYMLPNLSHHDANNSNSLVSSVDMVLPVIKAAFDKLQQHIYSHFSSYSTSSTSTSSSASFPAFGNANNDLNATNGSNIMGNGNSNSNKNHVVTSSYHQTTTTTTLTTTSSAVTSPSLRFNPNASEFVPTHNTPTNSNNVLKSNQVMVPKQQQQQLHQQLQQHTTAMSNLTLTPPFSPTPNTTNTNNTNGSHTLSLMMKQQQQQQNLRSGNHFVSNTSFPTNLYSPTAATVALPTPQTTQMPTSFNQYQQQFNVMQHQHQHQFQQQHQHIMHQQFNQQQHHLAFLQHQQQQQQYQQMQHQQQHQQRQGPPPGTHNKPSVAGTYTNGLSPEVAAICLEAISVIQSMLRDRKGAPLKQPGLSRKLYAKYPHFESAIKEAGGLRAFVKRFPNVFRLFPGKGSVWFVMLRNEKEDGSNGTDENNDDNSYKTGEHDMDDMDADDCDDCDDDVADCDD